MKEQYQVNWKDYYEILQVVPTADVEVITAAYKKLASKYHPDTQTVYAAYQAHDKMKDLKEAYEVLKDKVKRAAYDREYYTRTTSSQGSSSQAIKDTREAWLHNLAVKIGEDFDALGYALPLNFKGDLKIRFSCGFPKGSRGGKKAIGQCWTHRASQDDHYEIFITPEMSLSLDVAAVAVHELVHAAVGTEQGHKGLFRTCALGIGLEGKMTSTLAGERLKARLTQIIKLIGDYPHAALNAQDAPKKEGTRLIKVVCPDCGYTVRVAQKWILAGYPVCPCGKEMVKG